jgi:hypothetical protein
MACLIDPDKNVLQIVQDSEHYTCARTDPT